MEHVHESPLVMLVPLLLLAVGRVLAGYIARTAGSSARHAQEFWRRRIFNAPSNHILARACTQVPAWVAAGAARRGPGRHRARLCAATWSVPLLPDAARRALPRRLPVPAEQVVLRRALRRDLRAAADAARRASSGRPATPPSSTACRTASAGPHGRRLARRGEASRPATSATMPSSC